MNRILTLLALSCLLFATSCGNSEVAENTDTTPKDSLSVLNEKIRKDPNNLDLYYQRAMFAVGRKDYPSAMADINRVLAVDSSTTKYLLAGADIHFFAMKVQRADQLLKRAVEVDPKSTDCMLRLAQLHHYLRRFEEEIVLLDKVLDLDKRNSQAFFMKGMVHKEMGDTTKAMSNMRLAVQMDPDYYNAYVQMGLIMAAQKNPLAIEYYRNAIEIQPASQEVVYNLGMFHQESEDYRKAIEAYQALLKLNPHHFDAHYNLGVIYTHKLDSAAQGMTYFNLAVEDNPQEPRGYFGRGSCFEKTGDIKRATEDYKFALELDPQNTGAAKALDQLTR
ncbi:MAG: repeat-containing protein YrrB [Bacteroidota bacterium]|jgi:tetratricopeptide (TPR) repeat protein